jgi:hypothetical protein
MYLDGNLMYHQSIYLRDGYINAVLSDEVAQSLPGGCKCKLHSRCPAYFSISQLDKFYTPHSWGVMIPQFIYLRHIIKVLGRRINGLVDGVYIPIQPLLRPHRINTALRLMNYASQHLLQKLHTGVQNLQWVTHSGRFGGH